MAIADGVAAGGPITSDSVQVTFIDSSGMGTIVGDLKRLHLDPPGERESPGPAPWPNAHHPKRGSVRSLDLAEEPLAVAGGGDHSVARPIRIRMRMRQRSGRSRRDQVVTCSSQCRGLPRRNGRSMAAPCQGSSRSSTTCRQRSLISADDPIAGGTALPRGVPMSRPARGTR
jgi:hypothetical protein